MKFKSNAGTKVDAVQWTGGNLPELLRALNGIRRIGEVDEKGLMTIKIPGGTLNVPIGTWLVRAGEQLTAHTAEEFAASYSPEP
jgi:hypothetical protein